MMKLLSLIAALFIRTLHATLRVSHVDSENITGTPQYILSFWHAHLLLMLHSKFRRPISVMSSRSRDGEYIVRVFDWYGVTAVRGSSSRGAGAVLRAQVREARAGKNIVFTPDGPKGPPRVAKDGVIYAARVTGLPIVPVAFAAKKKSSCAPGTAWSSPFRSPKRCFSMASPSSSRVMPTSRSGGRAWNAA
jgi:lysophospholipid acyltransferase (LPLAT)-like uncharacterized protein